jgi:hypothetical protein
MYPRDISEYSISQPVATARAVSEEPHTLSSRSSLQCLFWFKGYNATFSDDERWLNHVMNHLTDRYLRSQPESSFAIYVVRVMTPGNWCSPIHEHTRAGEFRPDSNLMDFLEQRGIITTEEKNAALRTPILQLLR